MPDVEKEVLSILKSTLQLDAGQAPLTLQSPLLGHVPQLDSMAVLSILTSLEERLGIAIGDDEVDGASFESVEALVSLVRTKLDGD